jgi:hypothetical protein
MLINDFCKNNDINYMYLNSVHNINKNHIKIAKKIERIIQKSPDKLLIYPKILNKSEIYKTATFKKLSQNGYIKLTKQEFMELVRVKMQKTLTYKQISCQTQIKLSTIKKFFIYNAMIHINNLNKIKSLLNV